MTNLRTAAFFRTGTAGRWIIFLLAAPVVLAAGIGANIVLSNEDIFRDDDVRQLAPVALVVGVLGFLLMLLLWWTSNVTIFSAAINVGRYYDWLGGAFSDVMRVEAQVNLHDVDRILAAALTGAHGRPVSLTKADDLEWKGKNASLRRCTHMSDDAAFSKTFPGNCCLTLMTGANIRYSALHSQTSFVATSANGGFRVSFRVSILLILAILAMALIEGTIGLAIGGVLILVALILILIWYCTRTMDLALGSLGGEGENASGLGFDDSAALFSLTFRAGGKGAEKEAWRLAHLLESPAATEARYRATATAAAFAAGKSV